MKYSMKLILINLTKNLKSIKIASFIGKRACGLDELSLEKKVRKRKKESSGKLVMTSPLHGEGRWFKSSQAHSRQ